MDEDHPAESAGAHDGHRIAELLLNAGGHPFDHGGGAENNTRFHAVVGVGADHLLRRLQADAGKEGSFRNQGIQGTGNARHNGSATERPGFVHHRHLGSGSEVPDQAGRSIFFYRRHRADEEIRAECGGIIDKDVHTGTGAGPDLHREHPGDLAHRPVQGLIERRHHRAEDRPFKAGGVDAVQAENIQQLDRILILHFGPVGGDPGFKKQLGVFEHAERDIGIPHIERQKHRTSAFPAMNCRTPIRVPAEFIL